MKFLRQTKCWRQILGEAVKIDKFVSTAHVCSCLSNFADIVNVMCEL